MATLRLALLALIATACGPEPTSEYTPPTTSDVAIEPPMADIDEDTDLSQPAPVDPDEEADSDSGSPGSFMCWDVECQSNEWCRVDLRFDPPGSIGVCEPAPPECPNQPTCDCLFEAGLCGDDLDLGDDFPGTDILQDIFCDEEDGVECTMTSFCE